MDTSLSSQLDNSLNDSVTDGEENHSEASTSPAAPPQVSTAAESPGVTVVRLSDGQTVQGVIHAPQTSVIQSPQVQTVQIATVAELEDDESVSDTQKRREILSRRPSYRKILNELSSDSPAVPKIDEEKAEEEVPVSSAASASVPTSIYQTSPGQYITITQGRAIQLTSTGVEALQGSQTLTVASSPTPQPGATILQCAPQPGDSPQQFYIQGGQVLIQDINTHQITPIRVLNSLHGSHLGHNILLFVERLSSCVTSAKNTTSPLPTPPFSSPLPPSLPACLPACLPCPAHIVFLYFSV
uniref:cAMP-responsive element modulator n=1 Tax=Lates calcarifer TaxID=8187 RepID=A0A4W6CF47_LATCA